jgi:ABC-type transport system, involved in lipoprotein release, permease component
VNKVFYPRLAAQGIRKNGKFYIPYMLTCAGITAMFYILCAITFNKGMDSMPSASTVQTIMYMGIVVVGIFSGIFLFYTNSFLIKRRKKELGLYNILGMEKRHIGILLFFETLLIFIITEVAGIISGIVFNKLMLMLLYKILNFEVSVKFTVSVESIIITLILFAVIFTVLLLFNIVQLRLSNPIGLLYGSNVGEKEPKTKLIMTILGVICISAGYTIAIITENPIQALSLFFIAVILVIAGTYFLFIAGSIALLKLLRKNKKYYYTTSHFTTVSGMIYRMKQNAAGLASICILSTMVLVLVSTTVSLYIGFNDIMNNRFPSDIKITIYNPQENEEEEVLQKIKDTVNDHGRTISNLSYYKELTFAVGDDSGVFTSNKTISPNSIFLCFVTADDYNKLTGEKITLSDDEIACNYSDEDNTVSVLGEQFKIAKTIETNPLEVDYYTLKQIMVVVKDETVLNKIYDLQKTVNGDNTNYIEEEFSFDLDGSNSEIISCYNDIVTATAKKTVTYIVDENGNKNENIYYMSFSQCKQSDEADFYAVYGGLLFLGLFLGLLFLSATVLIIYYKQISEGYDDKKRFEIMQKVGMSGNEIKKSINSQVLTVFFIPILMAAVHILAAFKMISRLLALLNLTNVALFAICTIISVVAFGLIYTVVYVLTSKVYYRIVR